ncbi:MAG: hypothetical protein EPN97_09650 [Alphaproteobacteria bacterium]|nr:MAG: hypothetical protein EPN97_09650 [Alphaproteobacteria bacterium]
MFGCSSSRGLDAKVVNNALVVSFLTADPPRVWRADMTGLATATLELREGQPGKFRLVMKTPGGKEEDISTFTDRETAANALRCVTDAMLRGEGGSSSSASTSAGGGMMKRVFWIAIVLLVLYLAVNVLANALHGGGGGRSLPPGVKAGTAVPADKIFGGK